MNFIKKIFEGRPDKEVHRMFTRFGKGIFEKRAICNVRVGNKIKINTTFEYANDLVEFFYSLKDKMQAGGKILLKEKINLAEYGLKGEEKEKKGIYEINVNQELNKEQIKKLKDKVYFFLLNLNFDEGELKTKQKLPRPSKSKASKVDDKFCVVILDLKYLSKVKDEFFFDLKQAFNKAYAEHAFKIEDIILPEKIIDYAQARLEAKRKGRIIRKLIVGGDELQSEKDFVV
ncbi:hypothetical protein B6U80_00665 [Candidatus Pacearchaeota archaeon ex4484_26]|nr:MAG: hypothetical protein B6U80_00665 [Candidatus Pacearchaeota archaeon ex4484_26]